MNSQFFYLPFGYTYVSRLKSRSKLISWVIIYIIPTIYLAIFLQGTPGVPDFLLALLGIVLIYNFYETGYIQNDTETVKRELNPTMRLSENQQAYYETHKKIIYGVRLLTGVVLSFVFVRLSPLSGTLPFIVAVWSILLIYAVYNKVRNKLTLTLHALLVIIRFCGLQLLFISTFSPGVFILSLLAFPLINLIERASRFHVRLAEKLIPQQETIHQFRIVYYGSLCLLMVAPLASGLVQWAEYLIFVYFFIYRTVIYLMIYRTGQGLRS